MLLFLVLSQALIGEPADALQPSNRSEFSLLTERLAALESAVAEREAKIETLERRLREIEHQHRREQSDPGFDPGNAFDQSLGIRYRDHQISGPPTNSGRGEWFDTRPNYLRGQIRPYFLRGFRIQCISDFPDIFVPDNHGPDVLEFWIAPTSVMWKPLERGIASGLGDGSGFPGAV
jgi:hypothetical protein